MMPAGLPDLAPMLVVLLGAFLAGFTTGFAGFGTGLVSVGFWFHALPAAVVPPVVALASVCAQLVGLATVPMAFQWRRLAPFLIGGAIGVPLGVLALTIAAPDTLRLSVGVFLVVYALTRLLRLNRLAIGAWGGGRADGLVGIGGGFLGGFAGLSAPLPLIWLQMRGGTASEQRSVYQPFNLIVLAMASVAMFAGGVMGPQVLTTALLCLPLTLAGAWTGARVYIGVSERTFRRVVLVLLLLSGSMLVAQG